MLAGGKEINYLMLNGEVFGAENNFPCFYKFGKRECNYHYSPNFYHLDYDKKNNPIMSKAGAISTTSDNLVTYLPCDLDDMDKATVISIMIYKNEKYALTDCQTLVVAPSLAKWGGK